MHDRGWFHFRDWSLFTAGGGDKGGNIEFEGPSTELYPLQITNTLMLMCFLISIPSLDFGLLFDTSPHKFSVPKEYPPRKTPSPSDKFWAVPNKLRERPKICTYFKNLNNVRMSWDPPTHPEIWKPLTKNIRTLVNKNIFNTLHALCHPAYKSWWKFVYM